jgi:hypothetical protein
MLQYKFRKLESSGSLRRPIFIHARSNFLNHADQNHADQNHADQNHAYQNHAYHRPSPIVGFFN